MTIPKLSFWQWVGLMLILAAIFGGFTRLIVAAKTGNDTQALNLP